MTPQFARAAVLATALCAAAAPIAARADDVPTTAAVTSTPVPVVPAITFDVALTASTDYVFRGVSQTNQNPAVFGEVDLASHGFHLSARTRCCQSCR